MGRSPHIINYYAIVITGVLKQSAFQVEFVPSSVKQVRESLAPATVELTIVIVSPATSATGLAAVPLTSWIIPKKFDTPAPGKTKVVVVPPPTAVVKTK